MNGISEYPPSPEEAYIQFLRRRLNKYSRLDDLTFIFGTKKYMIEQLSLGRFVEPCFSDEDIISFVQSHSFSGDKDSYEGEEEKD